LLHRLERLGYAGVELAVGSRERRRKYYRITDPGLAGLAEQRRRCDTVTDALKEIWLGRQDWPMDCRFCAKLGAHRGDSLVGRRIPRETDLKVALVKA
jgi:DNA-binding PadR family transcriptional regulator